MRPFVFRAQAALDFRRRRDEAARRDLAIANAAATTAEAQLKASVAERNESFQRARDAEAEGIDIVTLRWHRNWITGQQCEIGRRRETLAQRKESASVARECAMRTHMDVRVLEKLQTRARRNYETAERREEQKDIDWLAVLRSIARPGGLEGRE
jgi:flagellar export protein FliJ